MKTPVRRAGAFFSLIAYAKTGMTWGGAMRNILYAVTACAQLMHSIPSFAASPSLEIAGLKTSYVRGGVIEFTVLNRDAVTVYFYCAIEWQGKDGEWRELPYSMEDGRLVKGDRLYTQLPGEAQCDERS